MSNKKVIIVIAILLLILQGIGFYGLSKSMVGLYPDQLDVQVSRTYVFTSPLTAKKLMHSVSAGFDRFKTSFGDLTLKKYEYRTPTETQYASIQIRESLGCASGGSGGLFLYDAGLTISYCFTGIVGVVLLILSAKKFGDDE